ncbi:hypothetical protein EK0264_03720 [Epidermidibacterium keratini]|uniref:Major capsid protein E n=1 Tax=Epidermidibacterium keratini TaxID=1891644 RepID=A0A7L4YKX1_9ACTN|nr:major capsid protein [Epidermidibacterium keratini]QHB99478.1 hypothetical protein EK0264_03720 [Epidermidibacterium keratini]
MATLVTEYFKPAELTELSREIQADAERPADTNYRLQVDYLPEETTQDIDYRVRAGDNGIPSSAKFRAFDAEAHVGSRPGFTEVSGGLQPLGQRELITELDRLRIRKADAEAFRVELAKADRAATLATVVRMERAVAQTLLTGKTTLTNERGITQEADWGRKANRTVAAATQWTNADAADPIADLTAWQELVDREGTWVMSTPTFNLIRRTEAMRKLGSIAATGLASTVTTDFVRQTVSAYGLGTIDLYDAKFINEAGEEERILPVGKVLFVPNAGTGAAGRTVWGVTAEAMDPKYEIEESAWPGIVVGHYQNEHPKQDWVHASAIGFPVLANPDRTLAATVA